MLEMSFEETMNQNFDFKGFTVENFVHNEIISLGHEHTYFGRSWRQAEVEFIFKNQQGDIVPIEVKSGKRTKAKSLNEYLERFHPKLAYKFSANIGGFREGVLQTLPLYYARSYVESI